MMRLDLIMSGYIKGGTIVQKIKNQLPVKKGESDWHQTYLLHKKLEDSGIKCIYYTGKKMYYKSRTISNQDIIQ